MRCRGLQKVANPPYLGQFPFSALPVLHRIEFAVVSEVRWWSIVPTRGLVSIMC
jgi:hypothetical protein